MTRVAPRNTACRILLIRHAVAERNGRFQGHTNVTLAPAAGPQLRVLLRKISRYPIQAIYSSDLQRAHATANAVARIFDTEVVVRPGLREIYFGPWEGLSWRQIARRFPRFSRMWLTRFPHHPIPGAERFDAFKKRVTFELDKIVTANAGSCVAIVTHAGVARLILARALGVPDRNLFRMALDPGALSVIDFFQDGATVQLVNG
jgi:broad specificity phosphatase PhoE